MAPASYGFTPAEHAEIVERFVEQLDLSAVTLMVQDWGGPIGFAVATRQPSRFSRFVIGNTWAWPKANLGIRLSSRLLASPFGSYLIRRRNMFIEKIFPIGVQLTGLSEEVMNAYRGPFPTAESREPIQVFAREVLNSRPFLADILAGFGAATPSPCAVMLGDERLRIWRI
jgi:haloalkane dehalogenase